MVTVFVGKKGMVNIWHYDTLLELSDVRCSNRMQMSYFSYSADVSSIWYNDLFYWKSDKLICLSVANPGFANSNH